MYPSICVRRRTIWYNSYSYLYSITRICVSTIVKCKHRMFAIPTRCFLDSRSKNIIAFARDVCVSVCTFIMTKIQQCRVCIILCVAVR